MPAHTAAPTPAAAPVINQPAAPDLPDQQASLPEAPASIPTTSEEPAFSEPQHSEPEEAPTLDQTPLDSPLPVLSAENWPIIVQSLTAELGAAVWTAQHAAYIATEENYIVLAFHPNADTHLQAERLRELGETLARHYDTHAKLKTIPWQENYASARQIKQQRAEAAQQTALNILHNDPQAQQIQNTFGGQWLPDSVKLVE